MAGKAVAALSDRVFGYDVFISYAWADGASYPASLSKRLGESHFKTFLDKLGYVAGTDLRQSTRRRVRMSRVLIVVLRPEAMRSPWVLLEVQESLQANRIPVLIDVRGTFAKAEPGNRLAALLKDSLRVAEPLPVMPLDEKVLDGDPSAETIEAILKQFTFTRRETRQRQALGALALIFAVLATTALTLWILAEQRRAQVEQLLIASNVRGLAAQAQVVVSEQPDLGLLLAAKAWETVTASGTARFSQFDEASYAVIADSQAALVRDLQAHPQLRGHLFGHVGAVECLSFDHAGKYLASSGGDNVVRLWDWTSKRLLATLTFDSNVIDSTINADGSFVVACAGDSAKIWKTAPPYSAVTSVPIKNAYRVAISSKGDRCAVGSSSGSLFIVDLSEQGTLVPIPRELRGEGSGAVHAACFSPDGKELYVSEGGSSPSIAIWDVVTGKKTSRAFKGHTMLAHRLVVSPHGQRLAAGTEDGSVIVWNLDQEKVIYGPRRTGSTVISVAFAGSDEASLLSSHERSTVLFWNLDRPTSDPVEIFAHRGGAFALAVHPDGKEFVTGGSDAVIRIWSTSRQSAIVRSIDSDLRGVLDLAVSHNKSKLIALHSNGAESVPFNAGAKTSELKLPETDMRAALCMSKDGATVVLASAWDAQSTELWIRPTQNENATWHISSLPKGKVIASCGSNARFVVVAAPYSRDNYAAIFMMPKSEGAAPIERPLSGHPDAVRALAINDDESLVATASATEIRVWDISHLEADAKLVGTATLPEREPTTLAFAPNSRTLVCGLLGGSIVVADPREPSATLRTLRRHKSSISALCFDPSGRWMASAASYPDSKVTLWEAKLFTPVADLDAGNDIDDFARALIFAENGSSLFAATQMGKLVRWDTDVTHWSRIARVIAGRDLRPEEILQHFPSSATKHK